MKTHYQVFALAAFLVWTNAAAAAPAGGRIAGACVTNSQVALSFESTGGLRYQVQSCAVPGGKFWLDAVPVITATGNLASALVPAQAQSGFFRVLEFTNRAFWYDWGYYYEAPYLPSWGLGSAQSGYVHLDRSYEWYIDQANTGAYSGNNCGPSSVTMGIKWFDPSFSKTAEDARNTYLEGGGWWYTTDILNYLNLYAVPNTTSFFTGADQLKQTLTQGNLVILCISTAYLTWDTAAEHRAGRFYSYASGHFLVVKGWRMVDATLFFEVYDPNNWHAVYADKTPKGRNRHLTSSDLAAAISNWWNYLIVINRPAGGGKNESPSPWLIPVDPATIPHAWGR